MLLQYITGPLIGAAIGYCTNYIAVKMLFHPHNEVRIFGHRLPFTPGVIPKGKPRLAHAVGQAISGSLLTGEDITRRLTDQPIEDAVTNEVLKLCRRDLKSLELAALREEERVEQLNARLAELVSRELMTAVNQMELSTLVEREGARIIREKTQGTMFAMFVSDSLLESLLPPVGREVEAYIQENAPQYVTNAVSVKLDAWGEETVLQLLSGAEIEEAALDSAIRNTYRRAVSAGAGKAMGQLDIAAMVEEKINAMEMKELEKLIFSVMKKELNAIVNLGALIGLVLGLLNIFL